MQMDDAESSTSLPPIDLPHHLKDYLQVPISTVLLSLSATQTPEKGTEVHEQSTIGSYEETLPLRSEAGAYTHTRPDAQTYTYAFPQTSEAGTLAYTTQPDTYTAQKDAQAGAYTSMPQDMYAAPQSAEGGMYAHAQAQPKSYAHTQAQPQTYVCSEAETQQTTPGLVPVHERQKVIRELEYETGAAYLTSMQKEAQEFAPSTQYTPPAQTTNKRSLYLHSATELAKERAARILTPATEYLPSMDQAAHYVRGAKEPSKEEYLPQKEYLPQRELIRKAPPRFSAGLTRTGADHSAYVQRQYEQSTAYNGGAEQKDITPTLSGGYAPRWNTYQQPAQHTSTAEQQGVSGYLGSSDFLLSGAKEHAQQYSPYTQAGASIRPKTRLIPEAEKYLPREPPPRTTIYNQALSSYPQPAQKVSRTDASMMHLQEQYGSHPQYGSSIQLGSLQPGPSTQYGSTSTQCDSEPQHGSSVKLGSYPEYGTGTKYAQRQSGSTPQYGSAGQYRSPPLGPRPGSQSTPNTSSPSEGVYCVWVGR